MLPNSDYDNIYIETTKSNHGHGGIGWEFGTCLWSPSVNKANQDRYSLMRKPKKGDLIFHIYNNLWNDGISDSRLSGYSYVQNPCREVTEEPPMPGDWAGFDLYYRIDLKNYKPFIAPLIISELIKNYEIDIWNEIDEDSPKYYPFSKYRQNIRLTQGMYLSNCTPTLYKLFLQALNIQAAVDSQPDQKKGLDPQKEYAEVKRRRSEQYFFSRNPKLIREAKKRFGPDCQVCGFSFSEFYNEYGEGFCEAHHMDPLSERPERMWSDELLTSVDKIAILCANCHRMIHRRKPALTLDELRSIINS